jgi:hypothetical protein
MGLLKTSTTFNGRTKTQIEVVQMNAAQLHKAEENQVFDRLQHPTLNPEHEHHEPAQLMAVAEAYFSAASAAAAGAAPQPGADAAAREMAAGSVALERAKAAAAVTAVAAAAGFTATTTTTVAATPTTAATTATANGDDAQVVRFGVSLPPTAVLPTVVASGNSGLPSGVRLSSADPVHQAKQELATMVTRQQELLAVLGTGEPIDQHSDGAAAACVENHINQLNAGFQDFTRVMV